MMSPNSRSRPRPPSMSAWDIEEIRTLRLLAGQGMSPQSIGVVLGRTEFAVRNKAMIHGISLRRRQFGDERGSA
jgi:hypothetical protein